MGLYMLPLLHVEQDVKKHWWCCALIVVNVHHHTLDRLCNAHETMIYCRCIFENLFMVNT